MHKGIVFDSIAQCIETEFYSNLGFCGVLQDRSSVSDYCNPVHPTKSLGAKKVTRPKNSFHKLKLFIVIPTNLVKNQKHRVYIYFYFHPAVQVSIYLWGALSPHKEINTDG